MSQSGVTELIWHFAGYLHITDELARARAQYEELLANRNHVDLLYSGADPDAGPKELEELGSGRTGVQWPDFTPAVLDVSDSMLRFLDAIPRMANPDVDAESTFVKPYFPSFNIFDFSFTLGPNVTRQEYGNETNVDADQLNLLNDNDRFGVREGLTVQTVSGVDVSHEMSHMRDQAEEVVPEHMFPMGGGNPGVVGPNLAEIQIAKAVAGEVSTDFEMGLYVDGVLQDVVEEETEEESETETSDDDARREGAPPPIPEQEDDWTLGDKGLIGAELGSNTTYNGAVIVDVDEAVGTFVVLGDYYKTNSIAQVNIYSDSDQIQIGSADFGVSVSVSLNENEATNSAEFSKQSLLDEVFDFRGLTGFWWDIDISYGDYFDVKSLYQKNVMYSNDIVSQTSTGIHQQVFADGNGQWNSSYVADYGNGYDLVVILGNYHSGNFIHQTNVLLDNDWVVMTSPGEEGGSQTVYGGQNQLTNEASINTYGLDTFGSVSAGFEAFLLGLETKDRIEAEEWWSYSGYGSTKMKVLFVTGDYYDINFIQQTNILADADAAMQIGGYGSDQFVSTGGNTMTNFATIIDVGAYGDQYVGGEAYEDWTLVQTNIIASEDDEIVYGDADQLASEVVAFAYEHEEQEDQPHADVAHSSSNGDELGSIMA